MIEISPESMWRYLSYDDTALYMMFLDRNEKWRLPTPQEISKLEFNPLKLYWISFNFEVDTDRWIYGSQRFHVVPVRDL